MTKNKWLCISVLTVLSTASVAAAEHGSPADVEKLDTNGDGVVTTSEFEAGALDKWSKSDTNKDGKVSADEMKAHFGAGKHDEATHEAMSFTKLDANNDGKVEKSEVGKMPDAMFKKLDSDKSGSLSAAELEKGHPEPHGMGVGGVEHPEHDMMKGGLPGDTNKDGAVTKAEAQADAAKMAKKLDSNGDGKISKEEMTAMGGKAMGGKAMGAAPAGHGVGKTMKEEMHGGMHHPTPKPATP